VTNSKGQNYPLSSKNKLYGKSKRQKQRQQMKNVKDLRDSDVYLYTRSVEIFFLITETNQLKNFKTIREICILNGYLIAVRI
jgi:hypothetical protein